MLATDCGDAGTPAGIDVPLWWEILILQRLCLSGKQEVHSAPLLSFSVNLKLSLNSKF